MKNSSTIQKKVMGIMLCMIIPVIFCCFVGTYTLFNMVNEFSYTITEELDKKSTGKLQKFSTEKQLQAEKVFWVTSLFMCLGTFIGLFVSFTFIKKSLGIRSKDIANKISQLADGKFGCEIEVKGQDEIGEIENSAKQLQTKFGEMLKEIGKFSGEAVKASEELMSVSSDANSCITHQQEDTQKLSSAVQNMTSSAETVATNASSAASSAEEADREAANGKSLVTYTQNAISDLADHIQGAADVINRVEEHSNSIGTILDVIRGIAEQTNLLALNAAIEAARAGEQGRGFAVVADEVRTLAQRTQESTQEIQSMIEKLQTGSKEAVVAITHGRDGADKCLEQASKAADALEQITKAVSTINEMNLEISKAASEQSKVAEGISNSVENIKNNTEKTTGITQTTLSTSNTLSSFANNIESITKNYTFDDRGEF